MSLFGLAAICATGAFAEVEKIKVACIGDSITWGYAMTNRVAECYPARLQEMLGPGYEVGNFGDPGADATGAPQMVFLVNPTCGETPPLELRLPGSLAGWHLQDVERTVALDEVGTVPGGTIVKIPTLKAWQPLLLKRLKQ